MKNVSFIESVKKMSDIKRTDISIAKLSDETRFFNDAIRVQILNNPDNELLLRNLYTMYLEEPHKELQDNVFLFNSFVFLIIKSLD